MAVTKIIVFLLIFLGFEISANAQCAMCRAVLESDLAGGGTAAQGINEGIIYLMLVPYLLIATVGFFIYKHYKKNKLSKEA